MKYACVFNLRGISGRVEPQCVHHESMDSLLQWMILHNLKADLGEMLPSVAVRHADGSNLSPCEQNLIAACSANYHARLDHGIPKALRKPEIQN